MTDRDRTHITTTVNSAILAHLDEWRAQHHTPRGRVIDEAVAEHISAAESGVNVNAAVIEYAEARLQCGPRPHDIFGFGITEQDGLRQSAAGMSSGLARIAERVDDCMDEQALYEINCAMAVASKIIGRVNIRINELEASHDMEADHARHAGD